MYLYMVCDVLHDEWYSQAFSALCEGSRRRRRPPRACQCHCGAFDAVSQGAPFPCSATLATQYTFAIYKRQGMNEARTITGSAGEFERTDRGVARRVG